MVDSRIAWIQQYESGRIWYNKLTSIETKRVYLRNLLRFCKTVGKNPDQLIALKMEGQRNIGTLKEFGAETLLSVSPQNLPHNTPLWEESYSHPCHVGHHVNPSPCHRHHMVITRHSFIQSINQSLYVISRVIMSFISYPRAFKKGCVWFF